MATMIKKVDQIMKKDDGDLQVIKNNYKECEEIGEIVLNKKVKDQK